MWAAGMCTEQCPTSKLIISFMPVLSPVLHITKIGKLIYKAGFKAWTDNSVLKVLVKQVWGLMFRSPESKGMSGGCSALTT